MADLTTLLSRLDRDSIVRGPQFEHPCRWFLTESPLYRSLVKRVWLWRDWPGRWGGDAGIDLVAQMNNGGLRAIQAKAYDRRYSIKKADVDTFLSESGRAAFQFRLLIATTDHLGETARRTLAAQEKPIGTVLLSDLEAAEVDWPESPTDLRPPAPHRKQPLPHQRAAILGVLNGFEQARRWQLILPCGTGKTLVALWIAERLEAARVLVLVPS